MVGSLLEVDISGVLAPYPPSFFLSISDPSLTENPSCSRIPCSFQTVYSYESCGVLLNPDSAPVLAVMQLLYPKITMIFTLSCGVMVESFRVVKVLGVPALSPPNFFSATSISSFSLPDKPTNFVVLLV